MNSEDIRTVEDAFTELQRRGWGFARNRASGIIAVGPLHYGVVEVYAMERDPILAVKKAVERAEAEGVVDKSKNAGQG